MSSSEWVDAAPFRAHVRFVCDTAALPWTVVALASGIPLPLVGQLLDARDGRRVRRIAPEFARRLLALDPAELRDAVAVAVPARRAQRRVAALLEAGWTVAALADRLHLSRGQLHALAAGSSPRITREKELRIELLASATAARARRGSVPARCDQPRSA